MKWKWAVNLLPILSILVLFYFLIVPGFELWKVYNSSTIVATVDLDGIWARAAAHRTRSNQTITMPPTVIALNQTLDLVPSIVHYLVPANGVPMDWMRSYLSCRHKFQRSRQADFVFMSWNDTSMRDFIHQHYNWFITTYDSYPYHIQRVDAVRYFLLHHFGGLYIDLDIGCNFAVDFLLHLESSMLLPITSPMGVSNDFMVAKPRAAFLRHVLRQLPAASHTPWLVRLSPYFTVMLSTGPMFLSRCVHEFAQGKGEEVDKEVALLGHSDYTRLLFFHVAGSSWHAWDGHVIAWCQSRAGRAWLVAGGAAAAGLWLAWRGRDTRSSPLLVLSML